MKSKQEAVAEVRASRAEFEGTLAEVRARLSFPQLAEDALNLIDPDLTLLGRIKSGVQQNRLLSLAVLAGAGWLVGAPRRSKGDSRKVREADKKQLRATLKENKNDSGKSSGNEWPGTESGTAKEQGSKSWCSKGHGKAQDISSPPFDQQRGQHTNIEKRVEKQLADRPSL
jgi:hypothetical protein